MPYTTQFRLPSAVLEFSGVVSYCKWVDVCSRESTGWKSLTTIEFHQAHTPNHIPPQHRIQLSMSASCWINLHSGHHGPGAQMPSRVLLQERQTAKGLWQRQTLQHYWLEQTEAGKKDSEGGEAGGEPRARVTFLYFYLLICSLVWVQSFWGFQFLEALVVSWCIQHDTWNIISFLNITRFDYTKAKPARGNSQVCR